MARATTARLCKAISALVTASALAAHEPPSRTHRPPGRLPARGDRDRGRAVLRRLDPDRRRLSRKPAHRQRRVLVPPQAGRSAIGHEGRPRAGSSWPAATPATPSSTTRKRERSITTYPLSTSGGSFINDVVVTKRAAWFTDSFKPVLYRVPLGPNGRPGAPVAVKAVQLTGDYEHVAGVQRERHRRDPERQDARHRPVGHREALHREPERRDAHDRARGRRERAERRRDPARRQDALRRPEPAERRREDLARPEPASGTRRHGRIAEPPASTSRRRSRISAAGCTQ